MAEQVRGWMDLDQVVTLKMKKREDGFICIL